MGGIHRNCPGSPSAPRSFLQALLIERDQVGPDQYVRTCVEWREGDGENLMMDRRSQYLAFRPLVWPQNVEQAADPYPFPGFCEGGDTLEAQGEDLNALLTFQEGTGRPPELMLAAGWVQVVPKQRP